MISIVIGIEINISSTTIYFLKNKYNFIPHTPEFLQPLSFVDRIVRIVEHESFVIQLDRCEQSFAFRIGQKGG